MATDVAISHFCHVCRELLRGLVYTLAGHKVCSLDCLESITNTLWPVIPRCDACGDPSPTSPCLSCDLVPVAGTPDSFKTISCPACYVLSVVPNMYQGPHLCVGCGQIYMTGVKLNA